MSLLLGPSMDSNRIPTKSYDMYYHHFRTLYQYHKEQWAFQENSTRAYKSMRCATRNDRKNDVYLHELASALERDPCNIDHWHALVQALGPIGSRHTSQSCPCTMASTSTDSSCKECDRLVDGLTIDHETIAIRNKDTTWWGYDRCRWWYECLLQPRKSQCTIPKHPVVNVTTHCRRRGRIVKENCSKNKATTPSSNKLKEYIVNQLKQLEPFRRSTGSAASTIVSTDAEIINATTSTYLVFEERFETFLLYIDNTVTTENISYTTTSKRNEGKIRYVYVPLLQNDAGNALSRYDDLDDIRNCVRNPNTSNADFVKSRMIGYKLTILCHLYSVTHVGVNVHVEQLYDMVTTAPPNDSKYNINMIHSGSSDDDDDHRTDNIYTTINAYHPAHSVLCWLYRMGLNVAEVVDTEK